MGFGDWGGVIGVARINIRSSGCDKKQGIPAAA